MYVKRCKTILKNRTQVLLEYWAQAYDRELQLQRCKIYNAKSSLVRIENKKVCSEFLKTPQPTTYNAGVVVVNS
jgi:hypothetical protein